jgi:predicted nucleic acid-binding protein
VGLTSVSVLLEVLHRSMLLEAVRSGAVRPPNVLEKLRKRPEIVRTLSEYYTHTMKIPEMGISVRGLPEDVLPASQRVRREHGLLVGDSLLIALMRAEGLRTLATHDADLRRIKEITVAVPGDVSPGRQPSQKPASH